MSIFVIGINHKTAPVTVREKVYFAKDRLPLYLHDLLGSGCAREAVLLSTCNRSELYAESEDIAAVRAWFCAQTDMPPAMLEPVLYVHRDEAAVAHIMQVACGLDSMILGEPQILGQMKEAFSESCAASTVDTLFHRLFQQVFTVAKDIRTTTAIGACPVSVASAAVHFAKQHCPTFADASIALIGAGDTTALLMRYLSSSVTTPLLLVNRHPEKAQALCQGMNSRVYGLHQLPLALEQADIVFSATGSATPLVTQEMVLAVQQTRGGKPLMLMDIAVPRDVAPSVGAVSNVSLYCIDDLKTLIETHRQGREHAADKARDLIHQKSAAFMRESHSLHHVAHTIRTYRGRMEALCHTELTKAKQQLHQGEDPAVVLELFARAFIKKILHAPSVQLRQAGVEGRVDVLRFANELFSIPDAEVERL